MKRTFILLILSLSLLLIACEPLQTPPPEIDLEAKELTLTEVPIEITEVNPEESETAVSTVRPSATPMPTNLPIPSPEIEIIPGEMVEMAGGIFLMGCNVENNAASGCPESELPYHEVVLSPYLIDRFLVTNGQYQNCVEAGVCKAPRSEESRTRESYYSNPEFALYPVIFVTYDDAIGFCEWDGKRLPTEAEWEMAARSATDSLYPWGNEAPDCSLANSYNNANLSPCAGDTTMVGSYQAGSTADGVMDMAGNVWEWVADYYSVDYYANSPLENPQGPESGVENVVRGGGWTGKWRSLKNNSRAYDLPFYNGNDLGFRCAMDGE